VQPTEELLDRLGLAGSQHPPGLSPHDDHLKAEPEAAAPTTIPRPRVVLSHDLVPLSRDDGLPRGAGEMDRDGSTGVIGH
jgi:hypothetical protein